MVRGPQMVCGPQIENRWSIGLHCHAHLHKLQSSSTVFLLSWLGSVVISRSVAYPFDDTTCNRNSIDNVLLTWQV